MQEEALERLTTLTRADFEPHIGSPFRLNTGENDQSLDLELTETASLLESQQFGPEERHPFSIIFRGPAEPLLPQRIYGLEHDKLGQLSLFLVPLGPGPQGGLRYEAVFT